MKLRIKNDFRDNYQSFESNIIEHKLSSMESYDLYVTCWGKDENECMQNTIHALEYLKIDIENFIEENKK